MSEIARYTTPSITYKPKAVEINAVDQIYLVLKQGEAEILRKGKSEASIDSDGFTWLLTQEDTALLSTKGRCTAQIDYTSGVARYTTSPRQFTVSESAIDEVI